MQRIYPYVRTFFRLTSSQSGPAEREACVLWERLRARKLGSGTASPVYSKARFNAINAKRVHAKCNIAPALHAWRGLLVVPWSLYCEKCPTGISIAIEEYAPTPFLLSA